jgi:hypothetical protein
MRCLNKERNLRFHDFLEKSTPAMNNSPSTVTEIAPYEFYSCLKNQEKKRRTEIKSKGEDRNE